MNEDVAEYLQRVVAACEDVLGKHLTAVWTVGSLVTGDFRSDRSDADLLVISSKGLANEAKQRLAGRLSHRSLPCPAHGLDLVVYREDEVRTIGRTPHYEFSLSSGAHWEDDVSFGGAYAGGLIDLACALALGESLVGPRPRELLGAVPHRWVAEELLQSLHWHTGRIHDSFHDPTGANAVLNACRALYFRSHGAFVSKTAGAEWFLARESLPIVAAALLGRQTGTADLLDAGQVRDFVHRVIDDLASDPPER